MIKNSFIYALSALIEKAMYFVVLPVYTAYLTANDFGVIALMALLISIVTQFSVSPIISAFNRYYHSEHFIQNQLNFLLLIKLIISISLTSLLLIFFVKYIAINLLENASLIFLVYFYILYYFISSLESLCNIKLTLDEQAFRLSKITIIKVLFNISTTLILLVIYNQGVYAFAIGLLAGSSIFVLLTVKNYLKGCEVTTNILQMKEPLYYGIKLIPANLGNSLIQVGDRFVLKLIMGVEAVGIYSFNSSFAFILNSLLVVPNKLVMQPIALKGEVEPEKNKAFLSRGATLFLAVSIFPYLCIAFFSQEIVMLISSNKILTEGWGIIPLIALSVLLHGVGNYLGFGIVLAKRPLTISLLTFFAALINIVLNFLLIPDFGIFGAAIATLISYVLWNSLKAFYSNKYYGLTFDWLNLGLLVIIAILFSCIIWFGVGVIVFFFKIFLLFFYMILVWVVILNDEEKERAFFYIKTLKNRILKND